MSKYLRSGGSNEAPNFDSVIALETLSPSQLTGNQNNYNPGTAGIWRLSSDASRTITGILAGRSGQVLKIVNIGSNPIVLANQSGLSDAANRIITGTAADLTISADQSIELEYDTTTSRWRVSSSPASGGAGGAGEKVFNYLTFS